MMPTITKELIDDTQMKCEAFLFTCSNREQLMAQAAQLIFISELMLDYPQFHRETNFLDNLISAYEIKAERLDPTHDF